jgi:hypothetical protein
MENKNALRAGVWITQYFEMLLGGRGRGCMCGISDGLQGGGSGCTCGMSGMSELPPQAFAFGFVKFVCASEGMEFWLEQ